MASNTSWLQVDIVYLAMLHTGHCAAALLMIAAGKHVLVEKPFAMNEKEARKMVHAAKKKVRILPSDIICMWQRRDCAMQVQDLD